ncbi:MAG: RNA polymerase sporulation sigma factor SigK [Bacillota bacterium]|jgi:RNA polymerase sporulation-specific sigma factor
MNIRWNGPTLRVFWAHDAAICFIAYLNNNVFPALLSEEEERKNLLLWEEGDLEARNILIEHNLRLVAHICKKFENTGSDKDDLISIGTIGLIKGINTFKVSRGTRLSTYTARCIENEILMHLRAKKNSKGEILLQDPIGTDKEGNEVTLLELLGTSGEEISENVEQKEEHAELWQLLQRLSEREKYVLCMRYGLGNQEPKTQREIAKNLGISRSYVSRIEKKAINKLTKELDNSRLKR